MSRFLQSSNEPNRADWLDAFTTGFASVPAFANAFKSRADKNGTSSDIEAIEYASKLWEDLSLSLDASSDQDLLRKLNYTLDLEDEVSPEEEDEDEN